MSATFTYTYRVLAGGPTVVEAWEPFDGHTVMRNDSVRGWVGQITARPLPRHIELMEPGSRERMSAAMDHHAALVIEALAVIDRDYPGLLERDDVRVTRGRAELDADLEPVERLRVVR
jgi:hypothetical protein